MPWIRPLDFAKKIIMGSDLSDLSYLYRFGEYISEQELQTAGFLNRLPEETIRCWRYSIPTDISGDLPSWAAIFQRKRPC